MIVLLVATWSVGFASNTWQAIVKFSFKDELAAQAVKSVMPDKSFDTLAADALRMQICAAGMKKAAAMLGTPMDDMQLWRVDSSSEKPNAVENTTRLFYWSPRWPTARELCGQISITNQFQKLDTHSSASLAAVGRTQDKVNKIRADAALMLFFGPLSNTAKQIVAAIESESVINTAPIHAQIQQARVDLTQKMQAEAAAAFSDNGNNSDLIAQFGQSWVWAGSMHMEMARIKDMIRTATQVNITFEPGSEDFSKFTVGEVADAGQHVLAPYTTTAAAISMALEKKIQNDSAIPAMPAMTTSYSVGDFINGGANVKETIHKFFKRWSDETVSGFVGYLSDDGMDPIWKIKNAGDFIAGYAQAGLIARSLTVATIDGVEATASHDPTGIVHGVVRTVRRLLDELWETVKPGAFLVLYSGYFLGIWVPMVPFLIFSIGVVGWMISVAEAMLAAPLWAVMHMTPESGDSFIGGQQQGYLLLMSLFFRPVLMVIGLVFSVVITIPALNFFNAGFLMAFRSIQADSLTGIFSVAVYILIYCFAVYTILMMLFALPQTLPDRILKWIGGGVADMGEQDTARRIESGASSQSRAAFMAAATSKVAGGKSGGDGGKKKSDVEKAPSSENSARQHDPEGHGTSMQ